MNWFRSNIRLGSRLALFALAIQCLLSFGHFHGGGAQAAPALADAKQSGLHDTGSFAATHLDALGRASHEDASRSVRSKTRSDHRPDGQPTDDCAICAVMALANAMVSDGKILVLEFGKAWNSAIAEEMNFRIGLIAD